MAKFYCVAMMNCNWPLIDIELHNVSAKQRPAKMTYMTT